MTLQEWLKFKEVVDQYSGQWNSDLGRMQRDVLVEEASRATAPADVKDALGCVHAENTSFILGFQMGKRHMVELMDAMAVLPEAPKDEEPTFKDPLKLQNERESFR